MSTKLSCADDSPSRNPKPDLSGLKSTYHYDEWGRMIFVYRDRLTNEVVYKTPPTGKKRRWRTRR